MGFLGFMKKKAPQEKALPTITVETNSSAEQLDRLTEEGELPWGWLYRNKEFTEKINGEYSYFLNMWLESRTKTPLEHYSALKSFVVYLEDAERLCKSKGECFEFWFYEILASKDYIQKRKAELEKLTLYYKE